MSDVTNEINVEEIMEQIRREIKEKGYENDILSFDDVEADEGNVVLHDSFDEDVFTKEVMGLNHSWSVQTYRDLGSRGPVGFVKKVIRKCIRFYVDPVVEDQNQFNANLVRTVNLLNCYVREQNETINVLKKEIIELKKKNEELNDNQEKRK